MSKQKSGFKVVYIGNNGKRDTIDIEAATIRILDAVDDSMVIFYNGLNIVFSLPFKDFCTATRIPIQPTATTAIRRLK